MLPYPRMCFRGSEKVCAVDDLDYSSTKEKEKTSKSKTSVRQKRPWEPSCARTVFPYRAQALGEVIKLSGTAVRCPATRRYLCSLEVEVIATHPLDLLLKTTLINISFWDAILRCFIKLTRQSLHTEISCDARQVEANYDFARSVKIVICVTCRSTCSQPTGCNSASPLGNGGGVALTFST